MRASLPSQNVFTTGSGGCSLLLSAALRESQVLRGFPWEILLCALLSSTYIQRPEHSKKEAELAERAFCPVLRSTGKSGEDWTHGHMAPLKPSKMPVVVAGSFPHVLIRAWRPSTEIRADHLLRT